MPQPHSHNCNAHRYTVRIVSQRNQRVTNMAPIIPISATKQNCPFCFGREILFVSISCNRIQCVLCFLCFSQMLRCPLFPIHDSSINKHDTKLLYYAATSILFHARGIDHSLDLFRWECQERSLRNLGGGDCHDRFLVRIGNDVQNGRDLEEGRSRE